MVFLHGISIVYAHVDMQLQEVSVSDWNIKVWHVVGIEASLIQGNEVQHVDILCC